MIENFTEHLRPKDYKENQKVTILSYPEILDKLRKRILGHLLKRFYQGTESRYYIHISRILEMLKGQDDILLELTESLAKRSSSDYKNWRKQSASNMDLIKLTKMNLYLNLNKIT